MKRITRAGFAAILLVGAMAFAAAAQEVQETTAPEETVAASTVLSASDDAIRILKLEEGFSTYPYWDYAQWTVGYGTKCPDDKLEEYRQNGISEEAAEQLLRQFIAQFESELHGFMIRTGRQLDQKEFDALLLFSYNCGTGWAYDESGGLYNAIVSQATGSELTNAFARWCNAGGQIKTFLLRRRLCEVNIYLNGEYSQKAPDQFGYVLYDGNGGTAKPNVQGYDTVETAQIKSVATKGNESFAGWYTAVTGGSKVEVLDITVRNARLYARWGGTQETEPEEEEQTGTTVTVTASSLNVRSGPGTENPVVGSVRKGEKLVITETAQGSGYLWGKYRGGWICLDYTDYTPPQAPEEETPAPRMGTVRVNDCLRVRSGPSTGYSVVAYLQNGDRVEILEEKMVGAMIWGRVEQGWISMDYVELDAREETPTEPAPTEPAPTEPAPTEPAPTEPAPTEPAPTEPAEPSQPESRTGKVKVSDVLRVRSGPGTSHSVVGYLRNGDRVTITEQQTSGSMVWGRMETGWISMDYVELDATEAPQPSETVRGTVDVSDTLRVRTGPGTSYTICAYLSDGAEVTVTEQRTVGGTRWGKISQGWICLDYVKLETETPSQTKVMTVTADCLRVRSGAGTGYAIVGYLYRGSKVEILETQNGWGKTAQGWVSMDYLQ